MAKKKKWRCSGTVVGGKYLGEVEAATKKEAMDLAEQLESVCVSLCHQCTSECEDPEITEIAVEEIKDA